MIKKILNSQSKSISSASVILAVCYFLSAVLGLLRDRLLAGTFGASNELDVYYTAFTVPDFIALILIFGAIAAAIIPIFNSYLIKSEKDAWKYVSNLLNVFLGFLIIICFILIIFTPFIVSIIAPGFSGEKKDMAVLLMRIMFLSPIVLGASNIISGILQAFHRFLVTALAPLMYNLGIIIGILFLVPKFGLTGLAWGVVLGGVLHLLIQLPSFFFSGFRFHLDFNFKDQGIIKTIKLMAPRSLGLGAGQFNAIAITAIASTLMAGSIAIFNLANNLSLIFINTIAVSVSTAAFPSMSVAYLKNEKDEFLKKFSTIFKQMVFITTPLSLLILLLRAQIVRVILGAGKFDWIDTRLTTACLGILALNLIAPQLILFLSKTFYAAHNTKIPSLISILTVVFNITLSLFLVWLIKSSSVFYGFLQNLLRLNGTQNIEVVGLALAFSISGIIQTILLFLMFYRKFPELNIKDISYSFYKTISASAVMVIVVLIIRQILGTILSLQTFWGVFFQLGVSGIVGIAVYGFSAFMLKSPETKAVKNIIMRSFLNPIRNGIRLD